MAGFSEGVSRDQTTLFPERLDDWIGEDHLARVVDLFVNQLDLGTLGFQRYAAARTGRPSYHPSVLLKLFIYGYLNRIPSSRRLECEAGRNVELMWLTGRLVPDHKTIADFRRQNGPAIRNTCAKFVELCRRIGVLKGEVVDSAGSPHALPVCGPARRGSRHQFPPAGVVREGCGAPRTTGQRASPAPLRQKRGCAGPQLRAFQADGRLDRALDDMEAGVRSNETDRLY